MEGWQELSAFVWNLAGPTNSRLFLRAGCDLLNSFKTSLKPGSAEQRQAVFSRRPGKYDARSCE